MTGTILGRRHVAKPHLEADLAPRRAARYLARRYSLPPATALAVAEAANLAMGEARR
jgi:hypothetical protein